MKTIYKYTLDTTSVQKIPMPAFARVLTIQMQRGVPVLWALVEINATMRDRVFETILTGHAIQSGHKREYIGTYQIGTDRVFHVFELIEL